MLFTITLTRQYINSSTTELHIVKPKPMAHGVGQNGLHVHIRQQLV